MAIQQNRSHDVRIDEDVDFGTLIQNPLILKGLEKSGYAQPSPIQLQAIPLGRLGVNMIAQAKSGTGKTVVFAVIALEAIQLSVSLPQALIVAPTREIAMQIKHVVQQLGQDMPKFNCEALIGGLSFEGDIRRLKHAQVIVGTPGRLMALLETKKLVTKAIKLLVMDEADQLMSDTFRQQIKYIYDKLPINKQSVAFSATFTDQLLDSLNDFVKDPHIVKLTYDLPTLEEVQQYYVDIEAKNEDKDAPSTSQVGDYFRKMQIYKVKFEATADLLSKIDFYQCMIFVNSFPRAVELTQWLTDKGWRSGHICAGLSQEKRMAVMDDMRQFKLRVLVCSDLIARGIDIDRVNLVVNIDYPRNTETYLHRVGRTGRYGTSGIAVNLIATDDDRAFLASLHDQHVSIPPLPEHVSFSDYRKALDQDEQKLWRQHQGQRTEKEEQPLKFVCNKRGPSTVSKHQKNTTQPVNKKRARLTKSHKPTTISSSFDHTSKFDTTIKNNGTNRNEKGNPRTGVTTKRNIQPRNTQPATWNYDDYYQPSIAPPYPPSSYLTYGHPTLPPAPQMPFILPPNPLFPSTGGKKTTHWIPPDLYF